MNPSTATSPNNNWGEMIAIARHILARLQWWIAATALIVTAAAVLALQFVPNRYASEATLLVVGQQVPERYVVPTTSTGIAENLQAMTQEVLSRTRLEAIMDEFHLAVFRCALRSGARVAPVEEVLGRLAAARNEHAIKEQEHLVH